MSKKELMEILAGLPDDTPIFIRNLENEGGVDEVEPVEAFVRTNEYPDIPGAEPYREVIISTTYS